jgi:hypothetical protein
MTVGFPAYQVIQNELLEELSFGKFSVGDSFYTEEALATRFKVAKMTARAAMLRLVSEGFIHRRRGAGSFVVRIPDKPCRIKVTRHCAIGVLPGKRKFSENLPLTKVLASLYDQALSKGYMLYLGGDQAAPLLEVQADGIVILGELDPEPVAALVRAKIPTVAIGRSCLDTFPSVTTDMHRAGYRVWRHLHEHGYRRLAMVGTGKDAETVEQQLLPGIRQAMSEIGSVA